MSFVTIKYDQFFDRPAVEKRVDRRDRRVLAKTGGLGRRIVQRSMRKAGKSPRTRVSRPGQPPRYHTKTLRQLILFGSDGNAKSVVIGPKLIRTGNTGKLSGASTVPQLLEQGGRQVVKQQKRRKTYTYLPRPFIDPALEPTAAFMAKAMEQTKL